MSDVFISYSRRDSAFVSALTDDLRGCDRDVWVDVGGIRDAEKFPDALRAAVEGADTFVFVISPDSVASQFCDLEVARATALNKRIVPIALRTVPDEAIPDEIRYRNWIPTEDGRVDVTRVLAAIDADVAWDRRHTRITVRALEWENAGRDRSFLLRGSDLTTAEAWLTEGAGKDPGPSELDQAYVFAARGATSRRQRRLVGFTSSVAVLAVGLLIFALVARQQAVTAETGARAQALAAESLSQQQVDPERAVLLAAAAVRDRATYGPEGTMFALRSALDNSAVRGRFPAAGAAQTCGAEGSAGSNYLQTVGAPGLALRPDGRQLAEGLCDGTVRLLDPATRRIEQTIHLPVQAIQLAYSPDGSTLVVAAGPSTAQQLYAIDPVTGDIARRGPSAVAISRLTFLPDTSTLAFIGAAEDAQTPGLAEWNLSSGAFAVTHPSGPREGGYQPTVLAASPDRRDLLVGNDNAVGDGARVPGLLKYSGGASTPSATSDVPVTALAYSPDGRELAVGTVDASDRTTVALWNPTTLAVDRTLVTTGNNIVTTLAFSPDGSRLAYGTQQGRAAVVAVATGRPVVSLLGPTALIDAVVFSPDGTLVYTSSADGSVLAWRAVGIQRSSGLVQARSVTYVAADASGYVTLSYGAGVLAQRWGSAGQPLGRPVTVSASASVDAAFLSPDGRFVGVEQTASSGSPPRPLDVWDVVAGRIAHSVQAFALTSQPYGAQPAFAPGDERIALGTGDYQTTNLSVIDVDGQVVRQPGSTTCARDYTGYAFDSTGARLAAGDGCGTVTTYAVATGKHLSTAAVGAPVTSLAISPDGSQVAAAESNGVVTVLDAVNGRVLARLTQNTGTVTAIAYSPDGRYLATGGGDDTLRVFDTRSLAELRVLPQNSEPQSISFSSDGAALFSAGSDSVVTQWDSCTDCTDPRALLALAATQVTRSLTPTERREFGVH